MPEISPQTVQVYMTLKASVRGSFAPFPPRMQRTSSGEATDRADCTTCRRPTINKPPIQVDSPRASAAGGVPGNQEATRTAVARSRCGPGELLPVIWCAPEAARLPVPLLRTSERLWLQPLQRVFEAAWAASPGAGGVLAEACVPQRWPTSSWGRAAARAEQEGRPPEKRGVVSFGASRPPRLLRTHLRRPCHTLSRVATRVPFRALPSACRPHRHMPKRLARPHSPSAHGSP